MDLKKKDIPNYDKNYSKVMGLSNAGYSNDEIASMLQIPKMNVLDIVQTAYGRSLMYGTNRGES